MKKYDLSKYDVVANANDGADVELLTPDLLEKTGIVIRIMGKDSETFKKAMNSNNRKRIAKAQKSRKFEVDPDEILSDSIKVLADCTMSWENMELDGKPLEFSKANAEMVYTRFPWIYEQADAAANDRANFTKG